jgi:molybdate transport system regulatory protein
MAGKGEPKRGRGRRAGGIIVRSKVWLEYEGSFLMGEGRAELLRCVKERGSLAAAARSMGMAYSHAWKEVKEMTDAVGGAVVATESGGEGGGGSRLTALGEMLLERCEAELARSGEYLRGRNRRITRRLSR